MDKELLAQYEPLIWEYAHHPFKTMNQRTPEPINLKMTREEIEELFYTLQVDFIELAQKYDASKGLSFEVYITIKLGWKATNYGKRMVEERNHHSKKSLDKLHHKASFTPQTELPPPLIALMDQLPPRQKEVIELNIIRNFKVMEVASQMKISKQAVVSYRKHGLKKLKKLWEEQNDA
jgi:RNA polymerase sigma factor (sigma-70 family)